MTGVHTIGHSNHDAERFVALLQAHGITALADVRSQPFSRRFPHFRKQPLQRLLAEAGVRYVFLGRELGARREEPECFVDGRVDFERVADLPAFRAGLERVRRGTAEYRVALMCAEADPLQCHRAILISPALRGLGVEVKHILGDGSLLDHEALERRLLEAAGGGPDLFGDDALSRAYRIRGRAMAHAPGGRRR